MAGLKMPVGIYAGFFLAREKEAWLAKACSSNFCLIVDLRSLDTCRLLGVMAYRLEVHCDSTGVGDQLATYIVNKNCRKLKPQVCMGRLPRLAVVGSGSELGSWDPCSWPVFCVELPVCFLRHSLELEVMASHVAFSLLQLRPNPR